MNWNWVGWLVLAPVLEEVVFRGGLHAALLRRKSRPLLAGAGRINALVAAAFGLAHALTRSLVLGLAVLPMALVIGWVYERTGRVRHCVWIHAGCNAAWFAVGDKTGLAGALA